MATQHLRIMILTCPLALALIGMGCEPMNSNKSQTFTSPKPVHFTLGIEQDGQKLAIDKDSHSVRLKKKPFKIVFYFEKMGSMLVQASFEPNLVRKAEAGMSMDKLIRQDGTIVEDLLNPQFTLYISERGFYHNWLYLGPKTHRFDADKGVQTIPESEGGGFYCMRTVKQLDIDGDTVPLSECPEDNIYLMFFKVDRIPGSQRRAERQRNWLILQFE